MDLYTIIDALIDERNRIDRIIQSLDGNGRAGRGSVRAKKNAGARRKRPGRKSMDADARREVSERMKRYWAQRRGEESGAVMRDGGQGPGMQAQSVAHQYQETK